MLQENLLSNPSRFVYQNVETPSESETPDNVPPSPDDLTKGESVEKAVENLFYVHAGSGAEKLRSFLTKAAEEGATKLQFEKDFVSYWLDGEQYRISASFIREVKNINDIDEVAKWLGKFRNLNFDESGISYWHEGNKYNIPLELLRKNTKLK